MRRVLRLVLIVALGFASAALVPRLAGLRLPGNQQGFEPAQPIAYSHRLHAGELQIPCLYCHSGALRGRHAGIPAASVCMNCHRLVSAARATTRAEEKQAEAEHRKPRRVIAPEIQKLYDALGLGPDLQPDPQRRARPIEWVRIHQLPAFAEFDHRPHVAAAVACQKCHGPIETMERVRQFETLSMGWCVNCHRTGVPAPDQPSGVKVASTDCSICHH